MSVAQTICFFNLFVQNLSIAICCIRTIFPLTLRMKKQNLTKMQKDIRIEFEPQFSGFHDLMKYRVREILLVSSLYDAFVLEEDGRLAERIFSEYIDLNLHFIPRITKVSTAEEALDALRKHSFDLVITMAKISDMNPVEFGKKVKELDPEKIVVLLTYDVIDPLLLKMIRIVKSIDKVFYWSGESKILLSIIKFVEDLKNAPEDVQAGVQVILVIEDSPKYYSMFLPLIYMEIMTHTRHLISDGVNDLHRMLRMRARPKILLAETFEEGMEIYQKYKQNLLGIISDVRFPNLGKLDDRAGFKLAEKVKKEVPDLPVLLQSSNEKTAEKAHRRGATFLNKNSENLLHELRSFILSNLGFGDFVFRYLDGREWGRARNLPEMAEMIKRVPGEILEFHARRNHISIWLRARTEFELADELRPKQVSDFENIDGLRNYIYNTLQNLLKRMQIGVIKDFESSQLFIDNTFVRLGGGSLGGKGRGIAFINALLANASQLKKYRNVEIKTPLTFVIGSEVFEEFMEMNQLQEFAISTMDDDAIARKFLKSELPPRIVNALTTLLEKVSFPLAVRSSSILEDSQLLPFAGLYRTYMLPNNHPDKKIRLRQLMDAVKLVYASAFYRAPKEYVKNTGFRIEEEKMAVVVQQVAGNRYGDRFYPVISGVAQSYNFYPISHMEPQDGIVHLAYGLGKFIVDGEQIYRFSPAYPQMNLPYSSAIEFVNNSQNKFYVLDLSRPDIEATREENFSLKKLDISEGEKDSTLFFVGSSYSPQDETIQDTLAIKGPRVITFANILKYGIFPLADIVKELINLGKLSFGAHVEIEFAINLYRDKTRVPEFFLLQIRPMITGEENLEVEVNESDAEHSFCFSRKAIGNGVFKDIRDVLYVDPQNFDISQSLQIAREIEEFNQQFETEKRNYILIGFGRWGTADPWLGIPVDWHQISRAKVVIESNLGRFKVDPSLGSHFFHNLVSMRLGYFSKKKTRFVKHLRFAKPVIVKIDGKLSLGAILKPNS